MRNEVGSTIMINPVELPTPIACLSLNPAIDLTYEINVLKHDQKSRALATSYDPGGTGINVGRALEKLNANSHTYCIIAGKMGAFLESMMIQELSNIYTLQIEGETRINTTLLQHSPACQYEINALGPSISSNQLDEIVQHFLAGCKRGIGILTGSLPPCVSDDTYSQINIAVKKQGGRCIVDAPLSVMKETLPSKPFLIKPNLHELEKLQNKSLNSIEEIALEARKLVQQGIDIVCVSLAERGAILTDQENSFFCNSPDILVHSTVGAGDSMVAGLAYALAKNHTSEQALKFAIACGAGTAKKAGTQLFNVEELNVLEKQTWVKTLDI